MRRLFRYLLLALVLLVIILIVNTLRLPAHQLINVAPAPDVFIPDSAGQRLAGAIRIPTVSFTDYSLTDTTQFDKFLPYLNRAFPLVHQRLKLEQVNRYGLLYTWPGKNPALKPVLLMGHYDVVPVIQGTQRMWKRPPFAGIMADGYLYGRGTLDDKMCVLALLESVDYLLRHNLQPERTVLLAFGQDEETTGLRGAAAIAGVLKNRYKTLEYVLDEGGLIKADGVAGITKPVALIGVAEKGYVSLELTAIGKGGHSSMPPTETSIGMVAEAVANLEHTPFPNRLDGGVDRMLDYLSSEVSLGQRLVFANRWLFAPLIKRSLAQTNSGRAALRTTTAPTIFKAGSKDNVLAIEATATVNFRILPGDSVSTVIRRVKQIIDNEQIAVSVLGIGREPSPVSDPESAAFQTIHRTVRSVMPGVVVAPYTLVAATDSRSYTGLSPAVFRFSPLPLNDADIASLHGTNERIKLSDYQNLIRFYIALIHNSQGPLTVNQLP